MDAYLPFLQRQFEATVCPADLTANNGQWLCDVAQTGNAAAHVKRVHARCPILAEYVRVQDYAPLRNALKVGDLELVLFFFSVAGPAEQDALAVVADIMHSGCAVSLLRHLALHLAFTSDALLQEAVKAGNLDVVQFLLSATPPSVLLDVLPMACALPTPDVARALLLHLDRATVIAHATTLLPPLLQCDHFDWLLNLVCTHHRVQARDFTTTALSTALAAACCAKGSAPVRSLCRCLHIHDMQGTQGLYRDALVAACASGSSEKVEFLLQLPDGPQLGLQDILWNGCAAVAAVLERPLHMTSNYCFAARDYTHILAMMRNKGLQSKHLEVHHVSVYWRHIMDLLTLFISGVSPATKVTFVKVYIDDKTQSVTQVIKSSCEAGPSSHDDTSHLGILFLDEVFRDPSTDDYHHDYYISGSFEMWSNLVSHRDFFLSYFTTLTRDQFLEHVSPDQLFYCKNEQLLYWLIKWLALEPKHFEHVRHIDFPSHCYDSDIVQLLHQHLGIGVDAYNPDKLNYGKYHAYVYRLTHPKLYWMDQLMPWVVAAGFVIALLLYCWGIIDDIFLIGCYIVWGPVGSLCLICRWIDVEYLLSYGEIRRLFTPQFCPRD